MSNLDGSSALAVYDKPALMLPAIPTEGEIRSLAMIADYAARSNFLRSTAPKSDQQQRQADAFFVIMYGRELGIPPMTALKMIFVLDGQPSASTQAIVGLARRRGVEIDIPDPLNVTDSATVRVKRPGGEWKSFTFTMDMARKMGLSGKKNWTGMQPVMLIWRAAGMGLRFEAGDYIGGLYPVEETSPDTPVNEDGEPIGDIVISKPEPVTPAIPAVVEIKTAYEADTPKQANCLTADEGCQAQFKKLRDELRITSDAPYLERLGVKKYSDYTGTLDELFAAMRNQHAKFLLEGDHKPIGRTPEPVIDEPVPAALTAGEVAPGASPFDTGKPQVNPHTGEVEAPRNGSAFKRGLTTYEAQQEQARIDAANAELDSEAARALNSDIPTKATSPHYHRQPAVTENGAKKTMLIDMPIGDNRG